MMNRNLVFSFSRTFFICRWRSVVLAGALAAVCAVGLPAKRLAPLDPALVDKIEKVLPANPGGSGKPISDRAFWNAIAADPAYHGVMTSAETFLATPLPGPSYDLYLEYSKNGNRTHYQKVLNQRHGRVTPLVLAECMENKGRFLPALNELIKSLCGEKSWTYPAHDAKLLNFHGKKITIDLASSRLGMDLAMTDYLLGDKLDPKVRKMLRHEVRRRIIQPYLNMVHGKRSYDWWIPGTNNWNPVCHCGVVATALTEDPDRHERAEIVASACTHSASFLAGFTPDGYCSEGLGYWNYGFGHFVEMAQIISLTTGGRIDLMSSSTVRLPAAFGARIEIMNGISPAFADCPVTARPSQPLMWYVNRKFGLGLKDYDKLSQASTLGGLAEAMTYHETASRSPLKESDAQAVKRGIRTWFDKAGVFIGRPAPDSACQIGVAFKGGNNAENHNHNDIGSFVVLKGKKTVLLDPGPETYTKRTFGPHRYDSKLLNSYGHSVPVINGKLQRTGANAQGKIVFTNFTPERDSVRFDIKSAYDVPGLEQLVREFTYDRTGKGTFRVEDTVRFDKPGTYETALITAGTMKRTGDHQLTFTDRSGTVKVSVDTHGVPFSIGETRITEDASVKPLRVAIKLDKPVTSATVTLTVVP